MNFSVLMSLYYKEKADNLIQSLNSVFNQTVLPSEVIMVEDGPLTDELYKVLNDFQNKHAELKRVALQENYGLGYALNEGLKHCSYDLVARMDTDDLSVNNRFEEQLKIFQEYPQVEVVSAWIEEFDSDSGDIISVKKLPQFPFEIYSYGKRRCPINHPVVMFRKNTVEFAGGYLPFPLFEDYFLWVRLLLNGAKFYNIQKSLLKFRTSADMYKRRGGLAHALNEVKFQLYLRKIGYISVIRLAANICIRFSTRICPNRIRVWIYQNLLRK